MYKLGKYPFAITSIALVISTSSILGHFPQDMNNLSAERQKRCADLGIELSKCTDQEILRKIRICPSEGCGDQSQMRKLDLVLIILFGGGIAMAIGIAAVQLIRSRYPSIA